MRLFPQNRFPEVGLLGLGVRTAGLLLCVVKMLFRRIVLCLLSYISFFKQILKTNLLVVSSENTNFTNIGIFYFFGGVTSSVGRR